MPLLYSMDSAHLTNPSLRAEWKIVISQLVEWTVKIDGPKEIPVSPPNLKEKKGRYILLPTMKVFIGEDAPAIVPTESSNIPPQDTSVTTTMAPLGLPSSAPTLPLPAPLPRPSPIAVTTPTPVAPTSRTTTPFGAGFTADQLLATLLPSSVLLQNAALLQQNALASLLGLAAATTPSIV
ncbi:hypothetical protein GCK32_006702 [Trichostrongylus colubriformis]|uniref:Uncharacterized protein n=1 Tax=Trichostrongylus colubriformis TaxID=6319 RepID=A0AAN8FBU8_TRICO